MVDNHEIAWPGLRENVLVAQVNGERSPLQKPDRKTCAHCGPACQHANAGWELIGLRSQLELAIGGVAACPAGWIRKAGGARPSKRLSSMQAHQYPVTWWAPNGWCRAATDTRWTRIAPSTQAVLIFAGLANLSCPCFGGPSRAERRPYANCPGLPGAADPRELRRTQAAVAAALLSGGDASAHDNSPLSRDENTNRLRRSPADTRPWVGRFIFTTFTTVFLRELGDKTQTGRLVAWPAEFRGRPLLVFCRGCLGLDLLQPWWSCLLGRWLSRPCCAAPSGLGAEFPTAEWCPSALLARAPQAQPRN